MENGMTDKPLNLKQRMLGVMKDVEYIAKGDKTVNGQYRFVSHDAVVGKLHKYLVKHGILVVPDVESSEQDGDRTKVILRVHFSNVDDPGDTYVMRMLGYGIDKGDKGPGKAVSYAFKYALLKAFCLETGDDSDNDANVVHEPAKCLEFDSEIIGMNPVEHAKHIEKFVEEIAKTTGKHVEDVKREAVKRPETFIKAFRKKAEADMTKGKKE